jgi:hypothetical protein
MIGCDHLDHVLFRNAAILLGSLRRSSVITTTHRVQRSLSGVTLGDTLRAAPCIAVARLFSRR